MHNIDFSFAQDPNTLALAIIAGLIPAIIWMLFWILENHERDRPSGVLFFAFLAGVFMVVLALPVENTIALLSNNPTTLTILWAASEEILKFGAFSLILSMSSWVEVPIDYPVYMMVIALGFSGFENALYFLKPLQVGATGTLILAASMRFLGTALMHAFATCLPGVALGFAYFKSKKTKVYAALVGLAIGILVHSLFNLFIPDAPNTVFTIILSVLWLLTIVMMILFEKLRERGSEEYLRANRLGIILSVETLFRSLLLKTDMSDADATAILAGLSKKGIAPGSPEHKDLAMVIGSVRAQYAAYLVAQGTPNDNAVEASAKLIPDTVSPLALKGIFTVLKR